MSRRKHTIAVTVRIPRQTVVEIDRCRRRIALSPDNYHSPEDFYTGGRSAVIRLLITLGIRALKHRPPPIGKKGP